MPAAGDFGNLSDPGNHFVVQSEATLLASEPCPPDMVGKDWQTIFRNKLNIAWLPADKVFFRALQLPSSDAAEIASMVELQLEKVSPLPVTHIVWSVYLLPRRTDKPDSLQTVWSSSPPAAPSRNFSGSCKSKVFCRTVWRRRDWSNFWRRRSIPKASGFLPAMMANRL